MRIFSFVGDFEHAAIHVGIHAQGFRFVFFAIGHDDGGVAAGSSHDVAGREHVAILGHNHAAAESAIDPHANRGRQRHFGGLLNRRLNSAQIVDGGRRAAVDGDKRRTRRPFFAIGSGR